jgi:SNF2 family DNA or RNA helicase
MPDFNSVHDLTKYYGFPFTFRPDQVQRTELAYSFERCALFDDAGTGKTAVGTAVSLAVEPDVTLVVAPPILGRQWERWLQSLSGIGQIVRYKGSPKKRKELPIKDAKWLIMSIQIFKRDWDHLFLTLGKKHRMLLVDEATAVANSESDNFRAVRAWADMGKGRLVLMTATPVNHPLQAYAYIALKTPTIYRSFGHFQSVHVVERDFYDVPIEWEGLDLIRDRLMMKASRCLKEDVLDLHKPNYIPIAYELEPAHKKLYDKLMDEMLLELPNDTVIDATNGSTLYHASQQIVSNWSHFAGEEGKRPALWDIIDNAIEETDCLNTVCSKLIIFTYYKRTSASLFQYLTEVKGIDTVACYSAVSGAQQERNIDRFLFDPKCRILIGQPQSVGYGLNPQAVCWETLFAECPTNPMHFRQAVERIYRDGQKHVPNVRLPFAEGTVQVSLHERLLENDDMASYLQGAHKTLRQAIHGASRKELCT